jgi:hypothetical protein
MEYICTLLAFSWQGPSVTCRAPTLDFSDPRIELRKDDQKTRPGVRRLFFKNQALKKIKTLKKYKPLIYSYRNTPLNIERSFLFAEN